MFHRTLLLKLTALWSISWLYGGASYSFLGVLEIVSPCFQSSVISMQAKGSRFRQNPAWMLQVTSTYTGWLNANVALFCLLLSTSCFCHDMWFFQSSLYLYELNSNGIMHLLHQDCRYILIFIIPSRKVLRFFSGTFHNHNKGFDFTCPVI